MKKLFKIMFFISLAFILIFAFVLMAIAACFSLKAPTGSVGIIGGADGPTAILVSGSIVFTAPALILLCLFCSINNRLANN
ncbi:MAG: hypothetical protein IKB38_07820 [Clostridia bacterium]|nr:hypothetical protein [Clostridia bacterium]